MKQWKKQMTAANTCFMLGIESRSIPAGAISFFKWSQCKQLIARKQTCHIYMMGITKELSGEREREKEREREFAKLVRFWLVHFIYIRLWDLVIPRKMAKLFLQTVKPDQTPHSIISIWLYFFFFFIFIFFFFFAVVVVERGIRHQVTVI